MDDIMTMVAGPDGVIMTAEDWDAAGDVAAAVVDRLGESGAAFVFISGPFFGPRNRRVVLENLRAKVNVCYVVLEVDLEETIRRAANDGKRTLTKDPELIRTIYGTIAWDDLPAETIRIKADDLDHAAVVKEIEVALLLAER
jgi:hypothetical protein